MFLELLGRFPLYLHQDHAERDMIMRIRPKQKRKVKSEGVQQQIVLAKEEIILN